jgi:hypothetical protein
MGIKLFKKNKIYTCGLDIALKKLHDDLLLLIDEYIPFQKWNEIDNRLKILILNIQKNGFCPFNEKNWNKDIRESEIFKTIEAGSELLEVIELLRKTKEAFINAEKLLHKKYEGVRIQISPFVDKIYGIINNAIIQLKNKIGNEYQNDKRK